jgi:hypothetical protein
VLASLRKVVLFVADSIRSATVVRSALPDQIREASNVFGYDAALVNCSTAIELIAAWRNHVVIQKIGAQPLRELL